MSAYVADLSRRLSAMPFEDPIARSNEHPVTYKSCSRASFELDRLELGLQSWVVAAAGLILLGSLFVLVFYLNSRHRSADLPRNRRPAIARRGFTNG